MSRGDNSLRWYWSVWEREPPPGIHPRWRDRQLADMARSEASDNAACDLLNVLPTTAAGVVALLRYISNHEVVEGTWPDYIVDDDEPAEMSRTRDEEDERGVAWEVAVMRHVADALEKIA